MYKNNYIKNFLFLE